MHSSLAIHAKNSSLSSVLQICAASATKVSVVGPNEVVKKNDFHTQRYGEGADLDFFAVSVGLLCQKTITEGSRHTSASPPRLLNVGSGRVMHLRQSFAREDFAFQHPVM
jgi:hypothetical protein